MDLLVIAAGVAIAGLAPLAILALIGRRIGRIQAQKPAETAEPQRIPNTSAMS